jgi:uncharacterized protein YaeQ
VKDALRYDGGEDVIGNLIEGLADELGPEFGLLVQTTLGLANADSPSGWPWSDTSAVDRYFNELEADLKSISTDDNFQSSTRVFELIETDTYGWVTLQCWLCANQHKVWGLVNIQFSVITYDPGLPEDSR